MFRAIHELWCQRVRTLSSLVTFCSVAADMGDGIRLVVKDGVLGRCVFLYPLIDKHDNDQHKHKDS